MLSRCLQVAFVHFSVLSLIFSIISRLCCACACAKACACGCALPLLAVAWVSLNGNGHSRHVRGKRFPADRANLFRWRFCLSGIFGKTDHGPRQVQPAKIRVRHPYFLQPRFEAVYFLVEVPHYSTSLSASCGCGTCSVQKRDSGFFCRFNLFSRFFNVSSILRIESDTLSPVCFVFCRLFYGI